MSNPEKLFLSGLVGRRAEIDAQFDAAQVFLGFKKVAMQKCAKCGSAMVKEKCSNADCAPGEMKVANLIGAARGTITKAMGTGMGQAGFRAGQAARGFVRNNAAGLAAGAVGGAIAGGPDHRLSGAVVGAGLGAGAQHAGRGMMAARSAAADAATASQVKSLGQQAMGKAGPAVTQELSGAEQLKQLRSPTPAPQAINPLANQSPEALAQARAEMASGNIRGVGQAPAMGPAPGYVQKPMAQTQRLDMMPAMKKVAYLPFAVADDSLNAASGGGSSAMEKAAVKVLKFEIPSSAIRNIVEEAIDLGRIKIQAELGKEHKKEKFASPYDNTPLMDMKQRAAERFPEKVSPIEAIRTDFKSALKLLGDKVDEIRGARASFINKTAAEVGYDMKEMARLGGMPKALMSRRGLAIGGTGALIGGGLAYLGSRAKEEHGGRSQAEVDLEKLKKKQPEKPEGIRATIGKHVVNLHSDVAEQMRKHPVAATALGAGAGAGLALRLAPILGVGR